MKQSGIYSAFGISILSHFLIIVAIVFITAKQSVLNKSTMPYAVTLVDSIPQNGNQIGSFPGKTIPSDKDKKIVQNKKETVIKKTDIDEKMLKDRIDAIHAKKKLERLVSLRKIVEIGNHKVEKKIDGVKSVAQGKDVHNSQASGDYYSIIMQKIRQQWVFPESLNSELETIISMRISKDGSVTIDKVEKSSGNPLFDRSAIRAITNASPLPPPPQDMEIGVRFKP